MARPSFAVAFSGGSRVACQGPDPPTLGVRYPQDVVEES